MKTLIVKIGTNKENLEEIVVNNEMQPFELNTADFKGKLVVRVKNDEHLEYFKGKSRNFSIQFCGQFMQDYHADDLLFGAVFERKISPPYGSGVAMTFANYIDPSLESDLYCSQPWLLSPLICAMNRLKIEMKSFEETKENIFIPEPMLSLQGTNSINITKDILCAKDLGSSWPWFNGNELPEDSEVITKQKISASERRIYFNEKSNLRDVIITPQMIVHGDFFGPVVDFSKFCIKLGPMSFDISPYVEGQPITFVAKSQSTEKIFFMVQFDQTEIL